MKNVYIDYQSKVIDGDVWNYAQTYCQFCSSEYFIQEAVDGVGQVFHVCDECKEQARDGDTSNQFLLESRRCCAICRIHKIYAGTYCPSCTEKGYELQADGTVKCVK